jgi:serine/threonine protein kinase
MHEMGITHRDLKPDNIFISNIEESKGGGGVKIYKIGDFGFAERKKEFDIAMGTIPYMAPEMLRREKYDEKVDLWSLGIIAYEIIFGKLYFIGKNRWEVQDAIKDKPFALTSQQMKEISANYYDVLSKCLNKNPKERISIDELIVHPLFNKVRTEIDNLQCIVK